MKRIVHWIAAAALAISAFGMAVAPASAEERYGKQKVVYHINYEGGKDDKKYRGAMRNIQNHINAVGAENLDLRVVMHGNGVSMVLLPEALDKVKGFKNANATPQMQANIDGLKNQGVAFKICNNTLAGRKVDKDDHLYMVEDADIVPSGVAELAHLQGQGYTYIKP